MEYARIRADLDRLEATERELREAMSANGIIHCHACRRWKPLRDFTEGTDACKTCIEEHRARGEACS